MTWNKTGLAQLSLMALAYSFLLLGSIYVFGQESMPIGSQWVNVRDYGAKCDGKTDDSAAVLSAIAKAKGIAGAIVFSPMYRDPAPPSTDCLVGTDVVIPPSVTTYVVPGALISVPIGATLTILGPFPNGRWRTFSVMEEGLLSVGTGDGSQTLFAGSLPNPPIRPTAVSVMVGSVQVGTDDGAGNFIGQGISGTLNYSTGFFSLAFLVAPAPSVPIQIKRRTGISFGEFQSCQGGQFGPRCYSKSNKLLPEWWGAKCDGQNDDTIAIQAAITASEAFEVSFPNTPSPSVLIPPTPCKISSPLVIDLPITLAGENGAIGQIVQTENAPVITTYVRGRGAIGTGPSLVPGPGLSMILPGDSVPQSYAWLKLREHKNLNLEGLTAFSVEAFVKLTQPRNGSFTFVSSSGRAGASDWKSAFHLGMGDGTDSGAGKLSGSLTVNGIAFPLIGTRVLAVNAVHHVALTYDGSMIRLFLDGVLQASTAASGAITQGTFEEVSVGPMVGVWPNGTLVQDSPPGYIDSIQLSGTSRYSSDFSSPDKLPKSKFSADENTLALLNFDNIQGPWVVGKTKSNANIWFPSMNLDDLQLTGVMLRDLVLSRTEEGTGDGLFGFSTIDSSFVNVVSSQGNWDGMEFTGSCYRNHFTDIFLYGTYCDFCGGGNSGVNQFDGGQLDGGVVLMGLYGWQAVIHNLYGGMESSNQFGLVYTSGGGFGGGLLATGYACDSEATPPNFVSCFDYGGAPTDAVVLTAPYLTSPTGNSNPPIRIRGNGSFTLIAPDFLANAAAEMIDVIPVPGTVSRPLTVISPVFSTGTAPVLVDNHAHVDQLGQGVTNSCAGAGVLEGVAAFTAIVSNECITGKRPVICSDNSPGPAVPITCKASQGVLSAIGARSVKFSWAQF
jgi:hypothetical protein